MDVLFSKSSGLKKTPSRKVNKFFLFFSKKTNEIQKPIKWNSNKLKNNKSQKWKKNLKKKTWCVEKKKKNNQQRKKINTNLWIQSTFCKQAIFIDLMINHFCWFHMFRFVVKKRIVLRFNKPIQLGNENERSNNCNQSQQK